ncbi:hypothetical protein FGO68_gene17676 [Halteria grandinella]|uniref:Uncharacterized protein n=1 Tax=Halteria grandinella TaxID=5974 RepID=A0A8J8NKV7_HALGN|nr:hypothetical protein FGO68_gene17676 [Halteria grandinella]
MDQSQEGQKYTRRQEAEEEAQDYQVCKIYPSTITQLERGRYSKGPGSIKIVQIDLIGHAQPHELTNPPSGQGESIRQVHLKQPDINTNKEQLGGLTFSSPHFNQQEFNANVDQSETNQLEDNFGFGVKDTRATDAFIADHLLEGPPLADSTPPSSTSLHQQFKDIVQDRGITQGDESGALSSGPSQQHNSTVYPPGYFQALYPPPAQPLNQPYCILPTGGPGEQSQASPQAKPFIGGAALSQGTQDQDLLALTANQAAVISNQAAQISNQAAQISNLTGYVEVLKKRNAAERQFEEEGEEESDEESDDQ